MHVIAHWGCTNTVREAALMAVGKEVCCHTEDSTLCQQHTRPGDQSSYIPTPFRNKNCNLLNHLTCALRNRKDTHHFSLKLKEKKRLLVSTVAFDVHLSRCIILSGANHITQLQ